MRKVITFLLRLIVVILLCVFAYQKITWKELTSWVIVSSYQSIRYKFKTTTCSVISKIQNKLCWAISSNQTWWDRKIYIDPKDPRRSLLSKKVMDDLDRNQEFSDNLLQINQTPYATVGKDWVVVSLQTTSNHINDRIIIIRDGTQYQYPARYNFDNIYAYKISNPKMVYTTQGLNFLDKNMVYYQVKNEVWDKKTYFLNTQNGITQDINDAIPLLFFKDQYIFTTKPWDIYQDLYVYQKNKMVKFSDQMVSEINIDKNLISIYDPDDRKIVFYDVITLLPKFIIKTDRMSIRYLSFLEDGNYIWLRYEDNLTSKIVHERRYKSDMKVNNETTDIYGIKITDIKIN